MDFTHHLNKDAVVAGGVISLGDLLQAFQASKGGRVVLGALENNADKAADIIAQLLGADVNARAGNDTPPVSSFRRAHEWCPG